jgi:MFS family permease
VIHPSNTIQPVVATKTDDPDAVTVAEPSSTKRERLGVVASAFVVLFCIVGLALWGLPFYYDLMVQQFGWTRAQVTSGNALSKLIVGPIFGFIAGWIIDRFGPRRLMMAGILMAGVALVGLGVDSFAADVLCFLSSQCIRLRVWRAASRSGAAVPVVCEITRQGHGIRLPRHWYRRRQRPLDFALARAALRLANGT